MIDFDMSVRLRIGNEDIDGKPSSSLLSRLKGSIISKYDAIRSFIDFIAHDDIVNYRYTYEEGSDAYMILYDSKYPEGYYHNAVNKKEWFYKTHDANGNSVAVFSIQESYAENTVQRMEGQQMARTNILQSTSISEIYLTNCDESNIDPYIPLRLSYDQNGYGYYHYGRQSKFQRILDYVDPLTESFNNEIAGINEWLANHEDEEDDPINLAVIQQREEMQRAIERNNNRKNRRVHRNRN